MIPLDSTGAHDGSPAALPLLLVRPVRKTFRVVSVASTAVSAADTAAAAAAAAAPVAGSIDVAVDGRCMLAATFNLGNNGFRSVEIGGLAGRTNAATDAKGEWPAIANAAQAVNRHALETVIRARRRRTIR